MDLKGFSYYSQRIFNTDKAAWMRLSAFWRRNGGEKHSPLRQTSIKGNGVSLPSRNRISQRDVEEPVDLPFTHLLTIPEHYKVSIPPFCGHITRSSQFFPLLTLLLSIFRFFCVLRTIQLYESINPSFLQKPALSRLTTYLFSSF